MAERKTIEKAKKDKRQGKLPSTQAGEFVHEEIMHIRHGMHGARSAKQAIAIGLSKARRAGVDLRPPTKGSVSEKTRKNAVRAYNKGQAHEPISAKRSRAGTKALKHEGKNAVSAPCSFPSRPRCRQEAHQGCAFSERSEGSENQEQN